ncbi:hypothetical protein [Xenorhabdus sp. SGI246]|uniref:hypothetical protein n=1 Tax=Xenorhabdus sp. SGI246 TaxID=3158263 RepID=UPI00349F7241
MSDKGQIYSCDCQEILKNDLYIKLVRDYTNEPIPDVPYTLINKGIKHEGTSDKDGMKLEKGLTSTPITAKIYPSKPI